MDDLLTRYNQEKRNGRKIISSDYIIRKRGSLLHVCLNSPGCRFRKSGSCTMCDYGEGARLTEKKLDMFWPQIEEAAKGMTSILIGSLGSVLDPDEISIECLEKICGFLDRMPIETIIIETHYTMINEEICRWLNLHLPGKDIVIGSIANDRMFFVIDNFFQENITDAALVGSLSALQLGKQYVALTEKACKAIRIEKEVELSYFEKKALQKVSERNRKNGVDLANEICKTHRREGRFFDEILISAQKGEL